MASSKDVTILTPVYKFELSASTSVGAIKHTTREYLALPAETPIEVLTSSGGTCKEDEEVVLDTSVDERVFSIPPRSKFAQLATELQKMKEQLAMMDKRRDADMRSLQERISERDENIRVLQKDQYDTKESLSQRDEEVRTLHTELSSNTEYMSQWGEDIRVLKIDRDDAKERLSKLEAYHYPLHLGLLIEHAEGLILGLAPDVQASLRTYSQRPQYSSSPVPQDLRKDVTR